MPFDERVGLLLLQGLHHSRLSLMNGAHSEQVTVHVTPTLEGWADRSCRVNTISRREYQLPHTAPCLSCSGHRPVHCGKIMGAVHVSAMVCSATKHLHLRQTSMYPLVPPDELITNGKRYAIPIVQLITRQSYTHINF